MEEKKGLQKTVTQIQWQTERKTLTLEGNHLVRQWSLLSLLLKPIAYATTSRIITPPPQ